ncbi:hypothetical protein D3C80_947340 [compost metagenome]
MSCPKCKEHPLKKGNTAYGCSNFQVCGFKLPFEVFGKKLTDKHLADLISKGKTGKIKGLKVGDAEVDGKIAFDTGFQLGVE